MSHTIIPVHHINKYKFAILFELKVLEHEQAVFKTRKVVCQFFNRYLFEGK